METRLLKQCQDDLRVVAYGVKVATKMGRQVVILAASNNHRSTIETKLRFMGVTPQKVVVVTLDEMRRLKCYKDKELIIPKWTVINMLSKRGGK